MGGYQKAFRRYEKKYLITEAQYQALQKELAPFAAADAYGKTTILNIYYDTPDCRLIRASLDRPVYKEKLRLRTYGVPDDGTPAFMEIKKKYDGVVYKRRAEAKYREAAAFLEDGKTAENEKTGENEENVPSRTEEQIRRELSYFFESHPGLAPHMVISYDRIAMAGIEDPELRITFDTNIRYRTKDLDLRHGAYGTELLPPGTCLMELKITGAMPMELAAAMSRIGIFSTSYSKYGEAYTREFLEGRIRMPQAANIKKVWQPSRLQAVQKAAHAAGF